MCNEERDLNSSLRYLSPLSVILLHLEKSEKYYFLQDAYTVKLRLIVGNEGRDLLRYLTPSLVICLHLDISEKACFLQYSYLSKLRLIVCNEGKDLDPLLRRLRS